MTAFLRFSRAKRKWEELHADDEKNIKIRKCAQKRARYVLMDIGKKHESPVLKAGNICGILTVRYI